MQLFIDGVPVEALPGESLRDIIQKLALDTEELQLQKTLYSKTIIQTLIQERWAF